MEDRGIQAHDPADTELASRFTVRDYEKARASADREAIAEAIRRRFAEPYIAPVSGKPKHGFTMMVTSGKGWGQTLVFCIDMASGCAPRCSGF